MLVVVVTVIIIFNRMVHNVSETQVNNCDKCVDLESECNEDEIAMSGFGCEESKFCCVKKSI